MEDVYPQLDTLCRLCLTTADEMVNIFPDNNSTGTHLSIPMRIMACVALEAQANDDLPKSICADCRYLLEKSYYFRKRSQAADSKMRKHIRLLSLGKKSRIFSRTSEEAYEDELDFEDSLEFLRAQDKEREEKESNIEKSWKEKLQTEMDEEMKKYKEQLEMHKKEWCNEMRNSLRDSVKKEVRLELRNEMRQELKDELRDECMEKAKLELRSEVEAECRKEEKENLLSELEEFLKEKRTNSGEKIGENLEQQTRLKEVKRKKITTGPAGKSAKLEMEETTPEMYNEEFITASVSAQTVPFEMISAETEGEQNYFILHNEEEEQETRVSQVEAEVNGDIEQGSNAGDSYYAGDIDDENFQLAASEENSNNRDTTSYQMDISDMRFYKKEIIALDHTNQLHEGNESDVVVYNFAQNDVEQIEFINMHKKEANMKDVVNSEVRKITKPTVFTKNAVQLADVDISEAGSATLTSQRNTDTPKTFKCKSCPMVFSTENSLRRHMNTHVKMEQNGITYQCSECHIFVSCRSALTRHMIIHTGLRPHKCPHCSKSFVQKEILKRHLHTHTGERPHKCTHCERSFTQKVNLKQHIAKHHTENPTLQQYACHLCPKRFFHASGLSRHLAVHGGVSFQCTKCERTFGDRSSVKRHITNVHGIGQIEKKSKNAAGGEEVNLKIDDNTSEYIM